MSSLNAFLNPVKVENKKVIISKRFLDKDGNPEPFEIRAITQSENKMLMKKHTKRDKKGIEVFNRSEYMAELVANAVVYPNLNDAKIQEHFKCLGAVSVLENMLITGEYMELVNQVQILCGFDEDINKDIEEAKN